MLRGQNGGTTTVFREKPEMAQTAIPDDADFDGLSGTDEKRYRTDPQNPDTDRDGLLDGAEIVRYKTDPTKTDTDGDGLSDLIELRPGATNEDLNANGIPDKDERGGRR